jgi:hypothetical protein
MANNKQKKRQARPAKQNKTNQTARRNAKKARPAPKNQNKKGINCGQVARTQKMAAPLTTAWNTRFPAPIPSMSVVSSQLIESNVAPTSASANTYVLGTIKINPLLLGTGGGGRTAGFARLFEKFRYQWLNITYSPMCAVTTAGMIFMAIDGDPVDNLSGLTGAALINALEAMGSRCVFFNPYSTARVRVSGGEARKMFSEWLFVDNDTNENRWSQAGTIYWGVITATGATTAVGQITVSSKIKLSVPTNSELSSSSAGFSWLRISGPADDTPFGTLDFSPSNLPVKHSIASGKSRIYFYKAGVYALYSYQTMSVTGVRTMTFNGTCNAYSLVYSSGLGTWTNPQNYHPSGEAMSYALINVWASDPATVPYIEVTDSAASTHSGGTTSLLNFVAMALTTFFPVKPTTSVFEQLQSLERKLAALTAPSALAAEALKKAPPRLAGPAVGVPVMNSDTTFTGTITPFGGSPFDVNLEAVSTINQDLPIETAPVAPLPKAVSTVSAPLQECDSDSDESDDDVPQSFGSHPIGCECSHCFQELKALLSKIKMYGQSRT